MAPRLKTPLAKAHPLTDESGMNANRPWSPWMPAQGSRILFEEEVVSNLWAGTQEIVQKIYPISLSHAFSLPLSHTLTHTHRVPLTSQITLTSLAKVSARCVSSGRSNPRPPAIPQTPMHVALCYFKCEIHSPSFLLHSYPSSMPVTHQSSHSARGPGHRLQPQSTSPALTPQLTSGSHLTTLTLVPHL